MITPVKNISFKAQIPLKKGIKAKNDTLNYKNSFSFKNINFKGYLPNFTSFGDTLKENYFKLPKITLSDGSIIQAQPDKSQLECAKKLYRGDSLLFCAPTGTGKTAVAHYIISKNLSENKKTIYTTPLKALANDKLREFRKIYGDDNVGLLTGDIKINVNAPIQIMTTEIYNNQITGIKNNPNNLRTVIFDEAHYLGDPERGNVWENAIAHTPFDKLQILLLSATIGNSDDVENWIKSLSPLRDVSHVEVKSNNRFVPLVYYIHKADYHKDTMAKGEFMPVKSGSIQLDSFETLSERQKRGLEILFKENNRIDEYKSISEDDLSSTFNSLKYNFGGEKYDIEEFKRILSNLYPDISKDKIFEIVELLTDENTRKVNKIHVKNHENNNYPALINDLKENNMLPALIFRLSKMGATNVCKDLKEADVDLTTNEEKEEISKIIDKYLKQDIYLGNNFDKKMLLQGYAYHHAGELPQYKKLIEGLFSKKLLKVVSATSTLSAGINMPAKTVVITGTSYKIYNPLTESLETVEISANDFHQMTGRAGRRGIDSIGNVIFYNLPTPSYGFKNLKQNENKSKLKDFENERADELQIAYNLLESGADNLRSQFKPDWQNLASYYLNHSDDKALRENIKKYFKYYLSKNKDKEEKSMMNKFENYKTVLKKLGFIELNNKKEISLTPKGRILTMAQGINPLMLTELLYNGAFKNLEAEEICQILGYLAGSDDKTEDSELSDIISDKLRTILKYDLKGDEILDRFNKIKENYLSLEAKILKAQKESKIPPDSIVQAESFSGFSTFLFAYLNDKEINTVNNFRKITQANKTDLSKNNDLEKANAINEFMIKSQEGNVYKIISQVVSILNQITRICDYTLSNPNDYKNQSYWRDLKEKAETAILLVKQNPIWDDEAV